MQPDRMPDHPCGVYIHIPFCQKACHYCDFHFSTSTALRNDMAEAILQEMALTPGREGFEAQTVYFGGGTPSLMPTYDLERLLQGVQTAIPISSLAEITLEANPDDINPQRLAEWKSIGINRLSIGIQSFRDEDLRWMNRSHTAQQASQAIVEARMAGFTDLSIDLIFGLPGLPTEAWASNLDRAISLQIPHLSCYALTVEAGTPLEAMIRRQKLPSPDAGLQSEQYLLLLEKSGQAGYEPYEISNFSLPGRRSRHNSAYWKGTPYFGFGPSAHSFDGTRRRWNIASNTRYLASIQQGTIPAEQESLTEAQQINEYVMTSLRTIEGIDLNHVARGWGQAHSERLKLSIARFTADGKAVLSDGSISLTHNGRLFADGIAAALFL